MRPRSVIDVAMLRKEVAYNPKTGQVYALTSTKRRVVGHVFTSRYENTYIRCSVLGGSYYAHRVAWALMTGEQPYEIDHINGLRHDNRWENLRSVTHAENAMNQPIHRRKAKE